VLCGLFNSELHKSQWQSLLHALTACTHGGFSPLPVTATMCSTLFGFVMQSRFTLSCESTVGSVVMGWAVSVRMGCHVPWTLSSLLLHKTVFTCQFSSCCLSWYCTELF
jgi:hypothetical protein